MSNQPRRIPLLFFLILPLVVLLALQISPLPREFAVAAQESAVRGARDKLYLAQLKYQPWRAELWVALGDAYYHEEMWVEAANAYEEARNLGEMTGDGLLRLGLAYERMEQTDKARDVYRAMVAHGPEIKGAYERLYDLARRESHLAESVEILTAWQVADPNAERKLELCYRLAALQPDDAVSCLEELRSAPEVQATAAVFETALKTALRNEGEGGRWIAVGRALAGLGQWELAEQAFGKAVEAEPDGAEGWAFLGEAQEQNGEDGLDALKKGLERNPDSVIVNALNSLYWSRKGEHELALVHISAAVKAEPDQPVWQMELGRVLAIMGNIEEARQHYQAAIDLDRENPAGWRALAQFCVDYGVEVRETGLPAAREAQLLAPTDPQNSVLLGVVFSSLGDAASAERFLQQAVEMDASYARAHIELGVLYLNENRLELAKQHLGVAAHQTVDESSRLMAANLLERYFGIQ